MGILLCPVCGQELKKINNQYVCKNLHSFDVAKEGYVNLLLNHKSGDLVGDNKAMALSRKEFLSKGYYKPLADEVKECMQSSTNEISNVLDICCGEGYYTSELSKNCNRKFYGFDISKNMVRLAAKRKCGANFFVANISSIPVMQNSIDFAFHLFAPFHDEQFAKILKKDGTLVSVIPGKRHLFELKKVLYDTPYENDEAAPNSNYLKLYDRIKVKSEINLSSSEDIMSVFKMTPYYYHTPSSGMQKIENLCNITTEIEFVLLIYKQ